MGLRPAVGFALVLGSLALAGCSSIDEPTDTNGHIAAVDSPTLAGTPYDTLATALAVVVTDAAQKPVAGALVTWTTADGGKFTQATSVTDAAGIARSEWILGPAVGTQHATAATQGTSETAAFSAEADAFRAVSLSMGTGLHSCAIDSQSRVWCWNRNSSTIPFDPGGGSTTRSEAPILVALAEPAAQVVTGLFFTCALTVGGDVYCWGTNQRGELGNGTGTASAVPVRVALPTGPYKQLTANEAGACAVSATGEAYCWGANSHGRFGNGELPIGGEHATPTPRLVAGGFSWQQLSLGDDRACGVRTDRTVYCWGWNSPVSPLGIDGDTSVATPVAVSTNLRMDSVTVSGYHECGVILPHETYCWGENLNLGIPVDAGALRSPTQLPPTPAFQAVHSIHKPTFALGIDGKGYWWGPPMGATGGSPAFPTLFSGTVILKAIGTGNTDTCGIAADTNVVYCWTDFGWDGPLSVYAVPAPN